jgi:hypothetical protein
MKGKKILLISGGLLLLAVIIVSLFLSGSNNRNSFGANQHYLPDPDEKQQPVNAFYVKQLRQISGDSAFSIGLSKVYTRSNSLSTFISLAALPDMDAWESSVLDAKGAKLISKNIVPFRKKTCRMLFVKRNGYYIFKTAWLEPEYKNLLIVDYFGKDSADIAKEYFSPAHFLKKFQAD